MEGILKAESEVKELKVDEVEKHVDDSSSSSSSSDEDEAAPAEEFTRIESAVVVLNEKLSSSSSSSDEEGDDELIISSTVHDPVEDSGVVAVLEAESIAAVEAYKEGVEEALEKVDESESSESDMKVLPIEEEEEEAVVVAGSLETGDLVFNDSPPENVPAIESGSGSVVEDKVESPVLIPTMAQRVRSPTSWMSCCGLFQVLRRDC